MILQALYQLAERENLMEDPDYEWKRVAWLIRINKAGKFLGISGTHYTPPARAKGRSKSIAKTYRIPRQPTGRSGTKAPPSFFVDNAKYVFGLPLKGANFSQQEGQEKSGWFRALIHQCATETGDEGANAVATFLNDLSTGQQSVELPSECAQNDLFAFVLMPDEEELVHERPKIREYWKKKRSAANSPQMSYRRCLVSGQSIGEVGLFPLIENVPGASPSRIGLVSFNKTAFESYGWKRNDNAPISQNAAETCATALNWLLNPQSVPKLNLKLSADTVVCFWSPNASGNDFCSVFSSLLEANAQEVRELYRSIWRGKPPEISDPSAFYALTLSGTQGRVIIRDWLESTVGEVANHLALHFADIDIARYTPAPKERGHPPSFPLTSLFEALADPGENRWQNIPSPLATQFTKAAFSGGNYPLAALQRAILRYRAELGREQDEKQGWIAKQRNDARAAIIKAVMNRRMRSLPSITNYEEVKRDMDPNNRSTGYTLGCLMAVLERIQQAALNDVNASVVDRYFNAASATPRSVFVRLLKNSRHHVSKAKDNEQSRAMVFRLERITDELTDQFDPPDKGFPAHLELQQQGLFVLGYHQMRKWLWMTNDERIDWENAHRSAPQAYLWKTGADGD